MEKACGIRNALEMIGNKWGLEVIFNLCEQPQGFNELLRRIDGISPKVLSQRLKELVASGMAEKTVHPTNPPTVTYALTEKAATLRPILNDLDKWGDQFVKMTR
jgi:DNA-binding HxlR family transcriptional regulator